MTLRLAIAPIVEAVLDFDCDMPPAFDLAATEKVAREKFQDRYPNFQPQFLHQTRIEANPNNPPKMVVHNAVQALRHLQSDGKQLVQVRVGGFSFNRLAPYSSLDDYLPEIQRTWQIFVNLAKPVQIRTIRLRYINRIFLPLTEGNVELDDYLRVGPRLPDEEKLIFRGFLNQHIMTEKGTENEANTVLASEAPEQGKLPIIFDNCVQCVGPGQTEDWPWIVNRILSLRELKNRIFQNTLTPRCISLFQ